MKIKINGDEQPDKASICRTILQKLGLGSNASNLDAVNDHITSVAKPETPVEITWTNFSASVKKMGKEVANMVRSFFEELAEEEEHVSFEIQEEEDAAGDSVSD